MTTDSGGEIVDRDNDWTIADIVFLALLIWREARGEPYMGKVAVAWTVRDRVEHPKWWGDSYSGVMARRWQYSSLTAPGDPQLTKWPIFPDPTFATCLEIADRVIHGTVENPFPGADSYHATSISAPYWAKEEQFVGAIGGHKFYNVDGSHPENQPGAA